MPVELPCMCASIRRASRALTQMYDDSLRPLGLHATQFSILQALELAGEVSQSQLSTLLFIDSTTLTRNLRILRKKGWIAVRAGVTYENSLARLFTSWPIQKWKELEMKNNANRNYAKLVLAILAVWLGIAIAASRLLVFHAGSTYAFQPPVPLGLAVTLPILVFVLWYATSPGFREFVLSLNPKNLTIVQTWRIGGMTFVVLYVYGILPGVFALPAGWGDFAIGITAPFVAIYLAGNAERKASYIAWQLFGMLDLVTAVTLGVLASPPPVGILGHAVTTKAMTVLPLSVIPTFAVPLLLILHIISIAQMVKGQAYASTQSSPAISRALIG